MVGQPSYAQTLSVLLGVKFIADKAVTSRQKPTDGRLPEGVKIIYAFLSGRTTKVDGFCRKIPKHVPPLLGTIFIPTFTTDKAVMSRQKSEMRSATFDGPEVIYGFLSEPTTKAAVLRKELMYVCIYLNGSRLQLLPLMDCK